MTISDDLFDTRDLIIKATERSAYGVMNPSTVWGRIPTFIENMLLNGIPGIPHCQNGWHGDVCDVSSKK